MTRRGSRTTRSPRFRERRRPAPRPEFEPAPLESMMPIFVRAITYAVLFVSLVLVFVPAGLLSWSGAVRPRPLGVQQYGAMALSATGAFVALWCVVAFVRVGRGTPAPFDPPRELVVSGPYRLVRNPMYVGAGAALVGAALFYGSLRLLAYAGLLFLLAHVFVVRCEEPRLRRSFGRRYADYCRDVGRWMPRIGSGRRGRGQVR